MQSTCDSVVKSRHICSDNSIGSLRFLCHCYTRGPFTLTYLLGRWGQSTLGSTCSSRPLAVHRYKCHCHRHILQGKYKYHCQTSQGSPAESCCHFVVRSVTNLTHQPAIKKMSQEYQKKMSQEYQLLIPHCQAKKPRKRSPACVCCSLGGSRKSSTSTTHAWFEDAKWGHFSGWPQVLTVAVSLSDTRQPFACLRVLAPFCSPTTPPES